MVILILSFFLASSISGQVVFSRRVYNERGTSYQRIWTWNPSNGVLRALTHTPRDHYVPVCTSGAITFVSPEPWQAGAKLWSFDPASGEERVIGPPLKPAHTEATTKDGCSAFAKAGNLEACGKDEDLSISRAGQLIGRFNLQTNECPIDNHGSIGNCETPIMSLEWSPDGQWLLVTELGLETSSTAPQWLFDPATGKRISIASGVTNNLNASLCSR